MTSRPASSSAAVAAAAALGASGTEVTVTLPWLIASSAVIVALTAITTMAVTSSSAPAMAETKTRPKWARSLPPSKRSKNAEAEQSPKIVDKSSQTDIQADLQEQMQDKVQTQTQTEQPRPSPFSTSGAIYSDNFVKAIEPLYDLHMGCENMGPILYSIARFVKPHKVLEVGAGYTSIFLLQALHDNAQELRRVQERVNASKSYLQSHDEQQPDDEDYQLIQDMFLDQCKDFTFNINDKAVPLAPPYIPKVVIMDNMEHESTTAHLVMSIAKQLGIDAHLQVVVADCFEHDWDADAASGPDQFDFIWLDGITTDKLFAQLFDTYWQKHLTNGGYIGVHSTLTNTVTRSWRKALYTNHQAKLERQAELDRMVKVQLEVKPVDDAVNLSQLAASIREQQSQLEATKDIVMVFSDGDNHTSTVGSSDAPVVTSTPQTPASWYRTEPIGYGISKLVIPVRVESLDDALAWAEAMEAHLEDHVGRIEVVETTIRNTTPVQSQLHQLSFLEPHKRFQNSFTLFQKRERSYQEPIYSWNP